jgi:hypothetical protein
VDQEEIVVAAFTGNSNRDRGPRTDLIENIKKQDPDILDRKTLQSNGEIVYTIRITGTTFRPKVFAEGTYTVHVGEGDSRRIFRGVI